VKMHKRRGSVSFLRAIVQNFKPSIEWRLVGIPFQLILETLRGSPQHLLPHQLVDFRDRHTVLGVVGQQSLSPVLKPLLLLVPKTVLFLYDPASNGVLRGHEDSAVDDVQFGRFRMWVRCVVENLWYGIVVE